MLKILKDLRGKNAPCEDLPYILYQACLSKVLEASYIMPLAYSRHSSSEKFEIGHSTTGFEAL